MGKARVKSAAAINHAGGVVGLGIDLVEVERVRKMLTQWSKQFTARVFVKAERDYCESRTKPWTHYAVRFAVKEAVAKAFGTGISNDLGWRDIEVITDPVSGAPSVKFSPKGQRLADQRGIRRVLVSLSHTHDYAVAQAILLADENSKFQNPNSKE